MIHPLVLLASYTFIFGILGGQKPPQGAGVQNYTLWLFAGMLPWLLFSETVMRASGSIVEHANLVTKTMFPSEIVPVAIFLSSMVSHLLTVVLFAALVGIVRGHISPAMLLLPLFMLVIGLFAVGLGWITASLQVYLRDTAQVVTVIMTFWLWLTPIFVSEEMYHQKLSRWGSVILMVNPLVYCVRGYRVMILGSTGSLLRDLGIAAAFGIGAFVLGGLFFRHMKRGFADVL